MLISFIIPLYNCGPYIARCLDSLLDQGLRPDDFEIIVVNDGSTDNSRDIVHEYTLRHPEIILINQDNQGVGAARNKGITYARGDYLAFVDADDIYRSRGVFGIFSNLKGSPDVIVFDHEVVKRINNVASYTPTFLTEYDGDMKTYAMKYGFQGSSCFCFFKRTLLGDLRFSNIKIGEDALFMLSIYNRTNANVVKLNTKLYVYCKHEGSAMTRMDKAYGMNVMQGYIHIADAIKNDDILSGYTEDEANLLTNLFINYCAFTRLLSTPFTLHETSIILKDSRKVNLFPLPVNSNWLFKAFSFLSGHSILTWCVAPLYRHIYIPLLKKQS